MNYYEEIKNELIDNELTKKAKDYGKNKSDLIHYYNVGKLLRDAGKHYGEGIIKEYSFKLESEIGKKYNWRTLFRIRKYYQLFSSEKLSPFATILSWSHYIELLSIQDENEIIYYINDCVNNNVTRDNLRNKIKNCEYQRLPAKTRAKLIKQEQTNITDFVKNPIVIHNNLNINEISEKYLKKLIIEDMDNFLRELGNGFTYVGNEYKIKLGNTFNYIDILLFNYIYNAFIVVELKVVELKKQHIGQIQVYMNYVDKHVKNNNHNKTIGIIICKRDNKLVLEYSSDSRIYSTTYELVI